MSERLTSREVDFVTMLADKHTRQTAADSAGLTSEHALRVAQRLGLTFNDSDRLADLPSRVKALTVALQAARQMLADRRAQAAAARYAVDVADLRAQNARLTVALRDALSSRRAKPARPDGVSAADVRAWLREQQIPCPQNGPIPERLLRQYLAAHPGGES